MSYDPSAKVQELQARLNAFMDEYIYPNEKRHVEEAEKIGPWGVLPLIDELKPIAREQGLWNLFLPESEHGAGLTNLEYAPLCEIMGRSLPGARGLQLLGARHRQHGSAGALRHRRAPGAWLKPLLAGEIRSCFAMTEPEVASSDATNIQSVHRARRRRLRDQRPQVVHHQRHRSALQDRIFMGKTDPDNPNRHMQQSMVLVPMDTPGVEVVRSLPVFGFYGMPDRASEVMFRNVRVPVSNILLGEGRGFEIAQGRLGPGRIHHCMREIGMAERALEMMCKRTMSRVAFGKPVSEQGVTVERIAESRIMIEQARLLTCMPRTAWTPWATRSPRPRSR
jgi:acyl-CoA dehydrogenase